MSHNESFTIQKNLHLHSRVPTGFTHTIQEHIIFLHEKALTYCLSYIFCTITDV